MLTGGGSLQHLYHGHRQVLPARHFAAISPGNIFGLNLVPIGEAHRLSPFDKAHPHQKKCRHRGFGITAWPEKLFGLRLLSAGKDQWKWEQAQKEDLLRYQAARKGRCNRAHLETVPVRRECRAISNVVVELHLLPNITLS